MKRSAKNINIQDPATCFPWVFECMWRHKKRHDFRKLLYKYGMSKECYQLIMEEHDKGLMVDTVRKITEVCCEQIKAKQLKLPIIKVTRRRDPSSGKMRDIGVEAPLQQCLDYIAKESSNEIFRRRIVLQQVSSIKKRGQLMGAKMIRSWLIKDNLAASYASKHGLKYSRKCKYFVKLDIRKCFPTADYTRFIDMLSRDCGNKDIIWLWEELLKSHHTILYRDGFNCDYSLRQVEGMMIGSLPSCWAVQYMLSFIYRYTMCLKYNRRGKEVRMVNHALFFMDDLLLFGGNRSKLVKAVKLIIAECQRILGFEIKPSWHVVNLDVDAVDMMGFVIHGNAKVTIRGRVFVRARRNVLRYKRRGKFTLPQARRACSYNGYFVNSDSTKAVKEYGIGKAVNKAAKVVSAYDKRKAGKQNAESIVRREAG